MRPHQPPAVSLRAIADWLSQSGFHAELVGYPLVAISGISLSSFRIRPGDLYLALPGTKAHGASFVPQAMAAGAVAVLTDPAGEKALPRGVPALIINEPRRLIGKLSAWLYDEPARAMHLVGVTGTQGKTTTTWLAESALANLGMSAAVIGTVGTRIHGIDIKTALTTPEAPDLQALFAVMREQHVTTCLMEVSSHALVLGRVDGIIFDVAVFTNLGRDHLDFHTDVEEYFAAKASLFVPERARRGLVSIDDAFGRRLCVESSIPIRTFSATPLEERVDRGDDQPADWQALSVDPRPMGSTAVLRTPTGATLVLDVPMPGLFNVANAIAAVAACAELGIDPKTVTTGIAATNGVPGRMEWLPNEHGFGVVIDYAHKPDALRAALGSLRTSQHQRVILVIGAGGDRDHGKRPLMGSVAAELADVVIITDDNPRSENPAVIRAEVRSGVHDGAALIHEIGDRREAIHQAVALARPGDVVLIAGKGHETGQEIQGVLTEFDDRAVAREALNQ